MSEILNQAMIQTAQALGRYEQLDFRTMMDVPESEWDTEVPLIPLRREARCGKNSEPFVFYFFVKPVLVALLGCGRNKPTDI